MIDEKFIRDVFIKYFQSALERAIPEVIQSVSKTNPLFAGQEFISLKETMRRYDLSKRTLYNYHSRGHITLRSSGGKTFVSIVELDNYLRINPVVRSVEEAE